MSLDLHYDLSQKIVPKLVLENNPVMPFKVELKPTKSPESGQSFIDANSTFTEQDRVACVKQLTALGLTVIDSKVRKPWDGDTILVTIQGTVDAAKGDLKNLIESYQNDLAARKGA